MPEVWYHKQPFFVQVAINLNFYQHYFKQYHKETGYNFLIMFNYYTINKSVCSFENKASIHIKDVIN